MLISNILNQYFKTIEDTLEYAINFNFSFFIFDTKIYQVQDSSYKYTNFYFLNSEIKNDTNSRIPELIHPTFIGLEVIKKSNKPFKSGYKTGIVTGYSINEDSPKLKLAFIIDNDSENLVNVDICKLI